MAEEGHGDVAEKASKKQKLESSSPVSISLDREKVQKVQFLNYLTNINCLHLFFLFVLELQW